MNMMQPERGAGYECRNEKKKGRQNMSKKKAAAQMVCPSCGHLIPGETAAKHLGQHGGRASTRELSKEDAKAMQRASVDARKANAEKRKAGRT